MYKLWRDYRHKLSSMYTGHPIRSHNATAGLAVSGLPKGLFAKYGNVLD